MKALLPLSWLYAAGVSVDRRARRVSGLPDSTRPRVVSIGNLEAGGNGKTPLAIWWLVRAVAGGTRVAYVSRGYRGTSISSRVVACVLPAGVTPPSAAGKRLLTRAHPDLAREVGDEGALVAERVPEAFAIFCADKVRAVAAAAELGVDLVVLDDGFQSWSVARHTDVVLLDAQRPLDNGRLLPAGTLREAPQALRRADAVVFNGAATQAAIERAWKLMGRFVRAGTPVAGMARTVTLGAADGSDAPAPARMVAVSGIARPDGFSASLATAGIELAAHLAFRDHHRYTAREVEQITARARQEGAGIVTTEKDWVKLRHLCSPGGIWVARLDVSLVGDPLPG